MKQEEEELWAKMAEFTLKKCKEHCHRLGNCCSSEYCDIAEETLDKYKVPIKRTSPLYLGIDGKCVVPPQFRQLCTLHQCKINSFGCDPKDPKWTEEYFKLREEIEEIGFNEETGL